MKIVKTGVTKTRRFGSGCNGDCFRWEGGYYMQVSLPGAKHCCAARLDNGMVEEFTLETEVEIANIVATVE